MYKPPFSLGYELPFKEVKINDDFWTPILTTNAEKTILHQWKMLEETKCIDNFRIIAGEKEGFREGIFYWDSDAHKWAEAAANILVHFPDKKRIPIYRKNVSG